MIPASILLEEASGRIWDIAVIGAGPAGSLAARQAAQLGASVLLVDKAAFPRPKVCGCCLSGSALKALQAVGLGDLPQRLGARPHSEFRLAAGGRMASIPLSSGAVLSRESFDAGLVEEALISGAQFLPRTTASLSGSDKNSRLLSLSQQNNQTVIRSRTVITADGLCGNLLRGDQNLKTVADSRSRIGIGAVSPNGPGFYSAGTIFMACGKGGYAGLVRLEDGRLDIAAAVDSTFLKKQEGAAGSVAALLQEAGFPPVEAISSLSWSGTPALTRRRISMASERVFVIGDAAGFVEPFTGEGMAWALGSAAAVVPFALKASARWDPSLAAGWEKTYRAMIIKRQRTCRWVSGLLRHTALTPLFVRVLSSFPSFSMPVTQTLNAPLW